MKRRYFLWDANKRYRGLFRIPEEHAERLRNKGWRVIGAATPFRKMRPEDKL